MNRKIKKNLLISFVWLLFLIVSATIAINNTSAEDLGSSTPVIRDPIDIPNLAVKIPGLIMKPSTCTETECTAPWLAEYISGLYQYGLGAITILAVITMMIAGIIWVTAGGNQERIADAKKWIAGSLIGVLIAFTSYMILNFVNPALTELSPLKIAYYERTDLPELDSPDVGNGLATLANGETSPLCLGTGGINDIGTIARKYTDDKVTYRLGANGGDGTKATKKRPLVKCPTGQLCFDCSNFIRHLLSCVGKVGPGGSTREIFDNKEKVNSATGTSVNGITLQPGDLIGWRHDGSGANNGHVVIYIGNGEITQSHGGTGWQSDSVNILSFANFYNKYSYKDLRIVRIR